MAEPLDARLTVASGNELSKKVTNPWVTGFPPNDTFAVSFTTAPDETEVAETLNDVVLAGAIYTDAVELLAAKLGVPPYVAVRLCAPADAKLVLNSACPFVSVAVPIRVDPLKSDTVPLVVKLSAAIGRTVTVIGTLCPAAAIGALKKTVVGIGVPVAATGVDVLPRYGEAPA
jgi:hypothetical protein